VQTVYKCDFLGVDIGAPLSSPSAVDAHFDSLLHMPTDERRSSGIIRFASESFHVVVFSLLLEYLPTSYQRVRCCQQAWRLLALDGLLVIVTPDSRRQHRNRRVAADWRRDIESIGFARWRYEKLEHVHCMAFRKVIGDGRRPLEPGMPSSVNPLRIPQDHDDDDGDEVAAVDGKTGDIEDSSQTIELFTDVYRELSAVDCCDV
jgi:25S rRNA (adenine2142-N1)-methyltransferase